MKNVKLIKCEEALARLFDYLDHELNEHQHAEMEHHLKICRSCYSRAEFERRLKAKLGAAAAEKPTEEFSRRVRILLRSF